MVRDNIKIIKEYFKIVNGSKLWITLLFLTSILGHLTFIILPVFASNIILYLTDNNPTLIFQNIVYLAISYLFYSIFWYINYTSYSYNFKYSYKKLRDKIIDKIFNYDVEFTDKISKGKILNIINGDANKLAEMINSICEIIVIFVKVIILIIIFLFTNIYIGIFILIIQIIYLKCYDNCNINITKHLRCQQKYSDKLTDSVSQILNGLNEIKMFNLFNKMKQNFNIIAKKWTEQYMEKRKYSDIRDSLLSIIINFGKISLYSILVLLVLNKQYEINLVILLISYYESIMKNTSDLMIYSGQIRDWTGSIERVKTILNYSSKQQIEFGLNENNNVIGVVEFKNVTFSYKTKNEGIIKNINFIAEQNEITAIVGPSGSGKTTIINLLLRKYKMDKGNITIDGIDIYSYSRHIYVKNVIGVNQTPFVFNMSIRKNLSLIDSNFKNQIEACKRIGIHQYIMSLPHGYNTILSENGSNFSEGQKQLLLIARILLSKSEVLIFDEVTNTIDDSLTEKLVEILEDLKQDHTIIIVTHKKNAMKLSDKIIVLDKGKIVGIGTHKQLIKENEYYIQLHSANY
ncbi:MAG: ABC transporter ATP-binding protein [Bacilli bacterium]